MFLLALVPCTTHKMACHPCCTCPVCWPWVNPCLRYKETRSRVHCGQISVHGLPAYSDFYRYFQLQAPLVVEHRPHFCMLITDYEHTEHIWGAMTGTGWRQLLSRPERSSTYLHAACTVAGGQDLSGGRS